ncbi:MAG: MmcQ/YjbR family DNA-binding protein [Pseudomonadota bacterium]
MMKLSQFDAICGGLPQSEMVIQWMGSHVWKVGGKVFAIGTPTIEAPDALCPFTIKTDESAFGFLREEAGVGIAPHLPRGNWLRFGEKCTIETDDLGGYIERSHALIVSSLSKTKRAELGLPAN